MARNSKAAAVTEPAPAAGPSKPTRRGRPPKEQPQKRAREPSSEPSSEPETSASTSEDVMVVVVPPVDGEQQQPADDSKSVIPRSAAKRPRGRPLSESEKASRVSRNLVYTKEEEEELLQNTGEKNHSDAVRAVIRALREARIEYQSKKMEANLPAEAGDSEFAYFKYVLCKRAGSDVLEFEKLDLRNKVLAEETERQRGAITKNAKLERENEFLQGKLQTAERACELMEKQMKELEERYADGARLAKENDELKARYDELVKENGKLKAFRPKLAELDEENQGLLAQNERLSKEAKRLAKELERLKAREQAPEAPAAPVPAPSRAPSS